MQTLAGVFTTLLFFVGAYLMLNTLTQEGSGDKQQYEQYYDGCTDPLIMC